MTDRRLAPMTEPQITDASFILESMAQFQRNAQAAGQVVPENLRLNPFKIDVFDVQKLQEFVLTAAPPNINNYQRHGHMQAAGKMASEIASRLGLNRGLAEAAARIHDFGALATNRLVIHERVGRQSLGKVFGVHPDVLNIISGEDMFDGMSPYDDNAIKHRMSQMSDYQRVMILADIGGKRIFEKDGRMGAIRPYAEVLEYHIKRAEDNVKLMRESYNPSFNEVWTSERANPGDMLTIGRVYEFLRDWALSLGVDMEDVRKHVGTIELLGPIRLVLFDVGGVLIPNPDVSKPNAAYYSIAAIHHDSVPGECVFIDDKLDNVRGAVDAGMKALLFQSQQQIDVELRGLLGY